ncbi:hypothetical protein SK069_12480 [Patulibacter brassicae]|uniref:DUF2207 domain-containing protein n=1 Tax=Patulibacter brassicae TaxID=1705717 RepID=A0ABU4VN97_9ACTN|nr:hypothetical protein [Patulibacter brassicae]MDX8152416.1 hypothetical protein [Patulibacter brassicae]
MTDRRAQAMQEWARARGLEFTPAGLLPPILEPLRAGLGVGAHRAPLERRSGAHGVVRDDTRRREERTTHHLCEGVLPGGATGALGHHVSLRRTEGGDGSRWVAGVRTIVLVPTGTGSRAVAFAEAGADPGASRAALTIDRRGPEADPVADPAGSIVARPSATVVRDGIRWRLDPPEDEPAVERLLAEDVRSAWAAAPDGTRLVVELGALGVWVPGRLVTDAGELDALCRLASAVTGALAAIASSRPVLRADGWLGERPDDLRRRWVDAGVALRHWPTPPADVAEAQAGYAPIVRAGSRRAARTVRRWALGALLVLTLVPGLGGLAWSWWDDEPLGMAAGVAWLLVGLVAAVRAARATGREHLDDRTRTASVAWGLEAFGREHARTRALRPEDPEALRRVLDAPVPGRLLQAWQGDLAGGAPGHLGLWIDGSVHPAPPRHWLVAVVAGPPRSGAAPRGCDLVHPAGPGLIGLWRPVDAAGRSSAALDALAADAAGLAG